MSHKYLLGLVITLASTGCFVETRDDGPVAVSMGTLRVDWTIDGTSDPAECQQGDVKSLDVIVTASDGSDAGEYKESCAAMATSIDLPPGRYSANAVLLDSSGSERTTEIPVRAFTISSDTETSIPLDFPADSFR